MSKKKNNNTATKIAKNLLDIQAVKLRPNQPFQWASGILSPIYCDNRKTLSHPNIRSFLANSFAVAVENYRPFDLVAGVATGGIAHGALVADRVNMPFIYVRSSKKKHGTGQQVEGAYTAGQKCVVIEDLISTGKSSLEAVEALRNEGLNVVKVLSIFSYEFPEASEAFSKHNCEYESLCSYSTLLQEAIELGYIKSEELESLNKWRENPREWKR